jgi:hypothetical protein
MSQLLVVKDKVQRYARELFKDVQLSANGGLIIPHGSTQATIDVVDAEQLLGPNPKYKTLGLSTTFVNIWAPVLLGVRPSNDLFRWAATDISFLFQVKVFLRDDGLANIFSLYTLAGDTLDPGEFKISVLAMLLMTDDMDDALKPRFGGSRSFED